MSNETSRRVARINKDELTDLPAEWTNQERGQYLRFLLHLKGIDSRRLYRMEYYPRRRCWLLLQEVEPGRPLFPAAPPSSGKADELFFLQTWIEFRRTARVAWSVLAARSSHYARNGCDYQLPTPPQELSPADLASMLSGTPGADASFDAEGGWFPKTGRN